jgi:hypothetical protein
MTGNAKEMSPEQNIREEIDALAPFGISRSYRNEVEKLRKRILDGETTGDQISDYAYLLYYDKEERDKVIKQISKFQEKIFAHVGEEIIFYSPSSGIDDESTHLYGVIDNPELEARRDITVWDTRASSRMLGEPEDMDLDQGETIDFDWGRLNLFVLTGGLHVRRRGGGRFEYYGGRGSGVSKPVGSIVPEDIEYVSFTKAEIFVGVEEIEGWRKRPGNEEIYQELTQALKESSSSLV